LRRDRSAAAGSEKDNADENDPAAHARLDATGRLTDAPHPIGHGLHQTNVTTMEERKAVAAEAARVVLQLSPSCPAPARRTDEVSRWPSCGYCALEAGRTILSGARRLAALVRPVRR
jgi:hypothetical protein